MSDKFWAIFYSSHTFCVTGIYYNHEMINFACIYTLKIHWKRNHIAFKWEGISNKFVSESTTTFAWRTATKITHFVWLTWNLYFPNCTCIHSIHLLITYADVHVTSFRWNEFRRSYNASNDDKMNVLTNEGNKWDIHVYYEICNYCVDKMNPRFHQNNNSNKKQEWEHEHER